ARFAVQPTGWVALYCPLLPIPRFEEARNGIFEPRQQILTVQKSTWSDQSTLGQRAANFDRLRFGVDDPSQFCAAAEEVLQPFLNFGPRIIWGEDFGRQVRSPRKKLLRVGSKTKSQEAGF